ncbi:hypothetical protein PC129_g20127 [Phytophthora cactorum]|uniref:Bacterial Ig-like domain-containing protein n=1 Tax=Phytophthora cactorum TaxID=29920 RepID=A0A329T111_9STRA|nr:hypothetical protein PC112_g3092 [Phytophthora cactorum]KAG2844146.1 hypothetical protein PC111_g2086 [Phytophthora cactorum]KAG2865895.1 hypothetical protein PC113_g3314 [Phytophthora cactorum]KAG2927531.1 hypothetical protein PC114_g3432 [Phytophthora cactorum]KAG2940292.1 hypothetical protein PC115_g2652 [Phytophthora cactorum]
MADSPALCSSNTLWWRRTYGHDNVSAANANPSALDGFYCAIRDNQVEQVQRYIAQNPAAVFTKVFGGNQRTALYVASSFGRHKIVTLLLHRGADKDLQCDGVRPIDVAGFASAGSIDRMKVRALLQGDSCPQVILRLDDKYSAGETRRFRLQIHFSEPVDEFTQEDVTVSEGCEVTQFSMLRRDLYHATVQLTQESSEASVEVLAGAARAAVGGRCNAQSRPLQLLA